MAKFCGKCGSPLDSFGRCPRCNLVFPIESVQPTQPTQNANLTLPQQPQNKPKKKNFNKKGIIAIVVSIAIIFTGVVGFFAISSFLDKSDDASSVKWCDSVTIFDEKDAEQINNSITDVTHTMDNTYIVVEKGTAMDELAIGDVFCLDGAEETPLRETYVGKVFDITEKDNQKVFAIETPAVDEVFEELNLENEDNLDAEDIIEVKTLDGVTFDSPPSEVSYNNSDSEPTPLGWTGNGTKAIATPMADDDSGKIELTLDVNIGKEFGLEDDIEIKFGGKITLEEMFVGYKFQYDGDGIEDLSVRVDGKVTGEITTEIKGKLDFGKEKTKCELPGDIGTIEGLKKKTFPIAMLTFNGGVTLLKSKTLIEETTEKLPVVIGVMVYLDVSGEVTLEAVKTIDLTYDCHSIYDIFENGNEVFNVYDTSEISVGEKTTFEASGEADFHTGVSVLLYVMNVNVLDVSLVELGAEAEGKLSVENESRKFFSGDETTTAEESEICLTGYARLYLKAFGLNIKLKAKVDVGVFETSQNYSYTGYIFDVTIHEWGNKDANLMSWEEQAVDLLYNAPNYGFEMNDMYTKVELIDIDGDTIPEIVFADSLGAHMIPSINSVYKFNGSKYVECQVESATDFPLLPATSNRGEKLIISPLNSIESLNAYNSYPDFSSFWYKWSICVYKYELKNNILSSTEIANFEEYAYAENDMVWESYKSAVRDFHDEYEINENAKYYICNFISVDTLDMSDSEWLETYHSKISKSDAETIVEEYKKA